ncbi:MAG TPA: universal stress protein [Gemmataceae bacterium]|nr:universal stress protein [Gemmataceae bacterium]
MPNILVALDGSPVSEKALEVAVRLAQQDGRQLAAVTVLDRSGDPHLERLAEGMSAKARRHLEEVLQAAVNFARSRGVQLKPIFREGHPAEAIITCAEQEDAEVVVLGSRGSTTDRPGLGGTANQVSSHSPCTVMLVR